MHIEVKKPDWHIIYYLTQCLIRLLNLKICYIRQNVTTSYSDSHWTSLKDIKSVFYIQLDYNEKWHFFPQFLPKSIKVIV